MKWNPQIADLEEYVPGKPLEALRESGFAPEDVIKLGSNENPWGSSPRVYAAIQNAAKQAAIYPDDSYADLKSAIGRHLNVSPEQVITGLGSDQIIEFATRAILGPEKAALINQRTFAMYRIYARQCGAPVHEVPGLEHDLQEFARQMESLRPAMVFLCTPCNPIGDMPLGAEIQDFLKLVGDSNPDCLVVIDGAYMEFARHRDTEHALKVATLVDRFSNVLYTGTFSKVYGLGGMRVGYGISSREVIENVSKMRPPFNLPDLSARAAVAALADQAFVEHTLVNNLSEMMRYEDFCQSGDLRFFTSYANFITVDFGERSATDAAAALLQKGIIVRDLKSYSMNALRITIGRPDQNDRVFEALEDILSK